MDFSSISASWFARAKAVEELERFNWSAVESLSGYWTVLDLRGSTAFRQSAHAREAFIRAAVFARVARELVGPRSQYRAVFKELGDGLLVYTSGFRDAFEVIMVMDAVARHWSASVQADPTYLTLGHRAAVTFGEAHVHGDDFLGEPIDRVARLAAVSGGDDDVIAIVGEEVAAREAGSLIRDFPFVRFSEQFRVPTGERHAAERLPWAAELRVDRRALLSSSSRFIRVEERLPRMGEKDDGI